MKKIWLGSRPSEIKGKDKNFDPEPRLDAGAGPESSAPEQVIISARKPARKAAGLKRIIWLLLFIIGVLLGVVLFKGSPDFSSQDIKHIFSLQAALDRVEVVSGAQTLTIQDGETVEINFRDGLSIKKIICRGWYRLFPPDDIQAEITGVGKLPDPYQENIIPLLKPEKATSGDLMLSRGNTRIGRVRFTLRLDARDWISRAEVVEDRELKNLCYKNAIAISPSSEEARSGLAKTYEQNKQADRAIAEYEEVLKINPDNKEALTALVSLYSQKNRRAKLIETYQTLAKLDTKKADNYYYKAATVAEKSNLPAEALALYKKSIAANSANLDARQKLIKIYEKQNQWNLVATQTQELVKLDPNNSNLYLYLSEAYLKTNQLDQAVAAVEKAAKLNPKDAPIQLQCALLYEKAKKEDRAIQAYKKLVAITPKNATAFNNLGLLQEKTGDRKSAVANYEKAVSLDPDNTVFLLNLADAYEKEKQRDKAIQVYEKVAQVDKKNAGAWEALAVLYQKGGRNADVIKAYKELSQIEPKKILWHQKLASLYENAGNYTEAKKEYERILKLNPKDKEAKQKVLDLSIKRIQRKLKK